MRILIHSIYYAPELIGVSKYTSEMAEWLSNRGHEVCVVTAPPHYPEWKVHDKYSSLFYRHELINGVNVWRCPLWVPSRTSGLKRIIYLASFAISSFPIMLSRIFWRPNIIFVVEPPLFCAPTTLLTAWLCRARSWLHVQDFEVDAAFDLGILSSAWMRKTVIKIEQLLMNKFQRVSTISEQMIKQLETKGVSPERQKLFPNWVNCDVIYPLTSPSSYRKLLDIPVSNITFLYSGNMGDKQGLEIIIEAARLLLSHKNIRFIMCGQGSSYHYLQKISEGLDNVQWLPLQPLDKLNDLLNLADVHLLPQKADVADLVMPSKLTGMLASGRPVLATAFEGTQVAKVLESIGVVVPPENIGKFVKALLDLAENSKKRNQLGQKSRDYAVNHLGSEAVLLQFEVSLKDVIDEPDY